jgi:hypothetical protein
MAETSLVSKLKLKPGQRAAVIHAPQDYLAGLSPLPEGTGLSDSLQGLYDWVQIFVQNKAELEALLPRVIASLKPESLLWISFPKGTSKIQTDLTRDKGWDALQHVDLKWVNLISVNETWSAFSLRPYKPGEKRQSFPEHLPITVASTLLAHRPDAPYQDIRLQQAYIHFINPLFLLIFPRMVALDQHLSTMMSMGTTVLQTLITLGICRQNCNLLTIKIDMPLPGFGGIYRSPWGNLPPEK